MPRQVMSLYDPNARVSVGTIPAALSRDRVPVGEYTYNRSFVAEIDSLRSALLGTAQLYLERTRAEHATEAKSEVQAKLDAFSATWKENHKGVDARGTSLAFQEFASSLVHEYAYDDRFDEATRRYIYQFTVPSVVSFTDQGREYEVHEEDRYRETQLKGIMTDLGRFVATNFRDYDMVEAEMENTKAQYRLLFPGLDYRSIDHQIEQSVTEDRIFSFAAVDQLGAARSLFTRDRERLGDRADEVDLRLRQMEESALRAQVAAMERQEIVNRQLRESSRNLVEKQIADAVAAGDTALGSQLLASNWDLFEGSNYRTNLNLVQEGITAQRESGGAEIQRTISEMTLRGEYDEAEEALLANREFYTPAQFESSLRAIIDNRQEVADALDETELNSIDRQIEELIATGRYEKAWTLVSNNEERIPTSRYASMVDRIFKGERSLEESQLALQTTGVRQQVTNLIAAGDLNAAEDILFNNAALFTADAYNSAMKEITSKRETQGTLLSQEAQDALRRDITDFLHEGDVEGAERLARTRRDELPANVYESIFDEIAKQRKTTEEQTQKAAADEIQKQIDTLLATGDYFTALKMVEDNRDSLAPEVHRRMIEDVYDQLGDDLEKSESDLLQGQLRAMNNYLQTGDRVNAANILMGIQGSLDSKEFSRLSEAVFNPPVATQDTIGAMQQLTDLARSANEYDRAQVPGLALRLFLAGEITTTTYNQYSRDFYTEADTRAISIIRSSFGDGLDPAKNLITSQVLAEYYAWSGEHPDATETDRVTRANALITANALLSTNTAVFFNAIPVESGLSRTDIAGDPTAALEKIDAAIARLLTDPTLSPAALNRALRQLNNIRQLQLQALGAFGGQ